MEGLVKFVRTHKLVLLAAVAFVYAAKFAVGKSVLGFDILVLVAGGAILVAIYRWEPNDDHNPKTHRPDRRRSRR